MRSNQSELIRRLVALPHNDGGWGKDPSKSSLTVTSEVVLALCDHFAQSPVVVTPDELSELEAADILLNAAKNFIILEVNQRSQLPNGLDVPNCALALAAYLSLRSHAARRTNSWEAVESDFICACATAASNQAQWLDGKAGATWACVKAVALVDHFVAEARDQEAIAALDKSDIEKFRNQLRTRVAALLAVSQIGEPIAYSASVILDLTVSIRTWLESWVPSTTIDSAQTAALAAIYTEMHPLPAGKLFTFEPFKGTAADEQYYQVVAPAALLTSIDVLRRGDKLAKDQEDFWTQLFYMVADRMVSPTHFSGKPPYVLAHYARALAASQLREREIIEIGKGYKAGSDLTDRVLALSESLNTSLAHLTARIGSPGKKLFFAATNEIFIPSTAILVVLFIAIIVASDAGSISSILAAFGVVVSLTPLSFLIWARKEKFTDKTPGEKALSTLQFFISGGWIAIPIFAAFIISWLKGIAAAQFGH